jgi:hypothetical protein
MFHLSDLWLSGLLEVGVEQLVASKLVVGHESFGDVIYGDRRGRGSHG